MLLAANVFNSVVNALESDARRSAGGQRREPRVMLSTRVTILPCPQGFEAGIGAPLSVPVRDLSRGGLRFLLPRRLPLDTQFVALLSGQLALAGDPNDWSEPTTAAPSMTPPMSKDGAAGHANPLDPHSEQPCAVQPLAILCGVTYWQPLAKDLFAIGGQFLKVLTGLTIPNLPPRVVLSGEIEGESTAGSAPSPASPPRRVAS